MSYDDEMRLKGALVEIVRICVEAKESEQVGVGDGRVQADEIEDVALGALFK